VQNIFIFAYSNPGYMSQDSLYEQTVAFLYAQLPMFHRIGAAAYKADLNNTIALLEVLGNPHLKFKTIHIAGTNGKGSSSHLLAAAFQQNGYKVGLYTSPHLIDFRERFKINGVQIPKGFIIDFMASMRETIKDIQPSFFEWCVALCFQYFASEKVDIAIIETGLGGRLDSTNVILPLHSLITNISMDHANLLGNTLEAIAFEKAGIIKPSISATISEHGTTDAVFLQKANQENALCKFASDHILVIDNGASASHQRQLCIQSFPSWPEWEGKSLLLDLGGAYQYKNIAGVLVVLEQLRQTHFQLNHNQTILGLQNAKKLTGLRGRWDLLQQNPTVIADIAHNEAGIKEVMQQLKNQHFTKLHIVFGAVKDKDVLKVLALLPENAHYYWSAPDLPRALPVDELLELAINCNRNGMAYESVQLAFNAAKQQATATELILVTGSNFVVAEILPNYV